MSSYSEAVRTAQSYYNSEDADTFYATIWGGEDIHIGLYASEDEPIADASQRTVQRVVEQLKTIGPDSRIIDLGGGYGGSARYMAREYGAQVVSLNLSEVENERARALNREHGLADRIDVVDGNFEDIPYEEDSFDIVFSQDAFLHSGNREQVLKEIKRVLRPGGELVFTDPMQSDEAEGSKLQPVLDRLNLQSLGSPGFYRERLTALGFRETGYTELTEYLITHYDRVRRELESRYDQMVGAKISQEYADNMIKGLNHWVRAGQAGDLSWGIMHFRLPPS